MEKQIFSVREAADLMPFGRSRVYEEIKDGRLKVKDTGHRMVVSLDAIKDWYASLPDAEPKHAA